MVPGSIAFADAIPRTASGKLDSSRLPSAAAPSAPVSPRTELEAALAGIYGQVLGAAQVGVHDDFFALGGHSLLASRVVFRLREELGWEVPLQILFMAPTVAALAARQISDGLPAATNRPLCRTRTRSPATTSSMRCVAQRTAMPSAATRSRTCRRIASRP